LWTEFHSDFPTGLKYFRYLESSSLLLYYDQRIRVDGKHYVGKDSCIAGLRVKLLTDLSEIQQYLPEGHPDKFPVSKESSEVSLVGRYLKALVDKPQNTSFKKGDYVKILSKTDNNKYAIEDAWAYTTNNSTAYQWELMPEGFTPPLTAPIPPPSSFQIPEYVKCMECYGRAIKGTIYDTSNSESNLLNGLSWKSVLIEFRNLGIFFKPSTKEAYEAQQKPQTAVKFVKKGDQPEPVKAPGITAQIESVKDYGALTEEELRGIVSDLFYTPSEPSPKVDAALPMISFVIPPREI
jgi:hypothetical protein